MKNTFLHTSNVRRAIEAATALRNQEEGLPCLGVWHGEAGLGKTKAAIWYAVNRDARYMIPRVRSTQLELLCDLYATLKGERSARFHRRKAAFEACLRLMWDDTRPVIIDEADRLMRGGMFLAETLRDLSDRTGCPIIFVDTDAVLLHLMQQEQLSSRLAQVVKFEKLSIDEVVMAGSELCGLELSEAAAEVLHKRCRGFFRDLVVALASLERTASANKTKTPPADMADKVARAAIMRAA